jgi:hypothetical protein
MGKWKTSDLDLEVQAMCDENRRRMRYLQADYDPITGEGLELRDPKTNENLHYRKRTEIPDHIIPVQWLTLETRRNNLYKQVIECGSIAKYIEKVLDEDPEDEEIIQMIQRALVEIRYRFDFPHWAYMNWRVKDKRGVDESVVLTEEEAERIKASRIESDDSSLIPFKLNRAQLDLESGVESQRLKGLPIRIIFAKNRQCGGSTYAEAKLAWIQLEHKNGWNSVIVAQVSATAKKIQMMYEKAIGHYPPWLLGLPDNERLRFSQYGRSASDFRITYGNASNPQPARDAVISVGTYNNPDSLPGTDMALAHISELALWKNTDGKSPEDLFKSVAGGIMNMPLTAIIIESTPRGSGNYFADEYARAKSGKSAYLAMFIKLSSNPYDIEPVKSLRGFIRWMIENKNNRNCPEEIFGHKGKPCRVSGQFIWKMWENGSTIENIHWYLLKHLEFSRHSDMASEAPVDDIEAFANTDSLVFDMYDVDALEKQCVKEPIKVGDIYSDYTLGKETLENYEFEERPGGTMKIWEEPNPVKMTNQYIVVVDIGYFSAKADWSIIRVVDRSELASGGMEKTVLLWHGHIPHDYLAWKAVQVAKWYNNALLVFESNTLEKERNRENTVVVVDDLGNELNYILEIIDYCYDNCYMRRESQAQDVNGGGGKLVVGFHTNKKTKPGIVRTLEAAIRDKDFIEPDKETIEEFRHYERKQNGSYGAMAGCKDDRLMTIGIALYISRTLDGGLPLPRRKEKPTEKQKEYDYHNKHGEASF